MKIKNKTKEVNNWVYCEKCFCEYGKEKMKAVLYRIGERPLEKHYQNMCYNCAKNEFTNEMKGKIWKE